MKKSFLIIMILILCFIAVACNHQPDGQYKLDIVDEENLVLDKSSFANSYFAEGDEITIYARPCTDVDLVMYINGEPHSKQKAVKRDEGYIWEYSFQMPAHNIVVSFKVNTVEYYSVKSALNMPSVTKEEVKKVKKETGYIGVSPGNLTNLEYSDDLEDISKVLSVLEMDSAYKEFSDLVSGGAYTTYTIYTEDDTYTIRISNGYIWNDKKAYIFLGQYPALEQATVKGHSFVTYIDSFQAYTLDNIKLGEYEGLSKLEFVDYNGDVDDGERGYIKCEFGRLYICTDKIFYVDYRGSRAYYSLVGEWSFSDYFLD